jgi:alkanesulfonate monooxygenase
MFLMWPETEEMLYETMQDLSARAAAHGRQIDFGLRIHVIVRETEDEARTYARKLMSKFDPVKGAEIKSRAQDSWSLGVHRQNLLRENADMEGFVEPLLWTDIGKARSGAGGALVGNPDQIVEKLNRYMDMGFRAFIFSGYPLLDEADYFARYVLPRLPNVSMPQVQGRIPRETPVTPLTTALLR